MSIRLMTAVWRMEMSPTDKMVLLALADAANDDGVTWIALKSRSEGGFDLATKCSLSKRAIQLAIGRLCEAGQLKRVERPGRGVIYTVLPGGASDAPVHDIRPASDAPAGAPGAPKPSTPVISEAKASSQRVVDAWNEMAAKHPKVAAVRLLDNSRRQMLYARLKEHGEAVMLEAVEKFGSSPWLVGVGRDSKWHPNIDFILQPSSLRKVLEGSYGADDAPAGLPVKDQVKRAEEMVAFWRKIGREDEAVDAERKLAQLRAARTSQDNGEAVPLGGAAAKILKSVGGAR